MTFSIDPNLIENNEVRLTENASNQLAIEHVPSGNTITVDDDVVVSDIVDGTLPSDLDADGNNISNVGSLSTESIGNEGNPVSMDDGSSMGQVKEEPVFNNSVGDDEAIVFSDGAGQYEQLLLMSDNANVACLVGSDFNDLYEAWSLQAVTVLSNGDTLSGTTGTDGEFTVQNDGTDFYMENRTDSDVAVQIIGRTFF
jgi:hypothetical protein